MGRDPSEPTDETVTSTAGPRGGDGGTALYVYGVVPKDTSPKLFAQVRGVDPSHPVVLVNDQEVAAIASPVPLDEFGAGAIETRLRDPAWLEEKVRAHDAVLEAALGRAAVLPFRFGTIYLGEQQVREMLADRPDLARVLTRLGEALELGIKAVLDRATFRGRLEAESGLEGEPAASGRAYMERKRVDRNLDEAMGAFAAECADISHERLAAAAAEARANPVHRPEVVGSDHVMLLNGAYLVHADQVELFRSTLASLQERYAADGVTYELTGPWPPYNFVEEQEET